MTTPSGGSAWPPRGKADRSLYLLCGVVVAAVFVGDVFVPLGVAIPVLHVIAVLLSLASPRRRVTVGVAVLSSVATLLGFWVSPPGGEMWKVVFNRLVALLVIWATATLALIQKSRARARVLAQMQALAAKKELEMQAVRYAAVTETLHAVHDLFNNFLNNMRWFRIEAEEKHVLPAESLALMDSVIDETAARLKQLDHAGSAAKDGPAANSA